VPVFLRRRRTRAFRYPRIFADDGYPGAARRGSGAASGRWIVEIVKWAAWHKFVIFTKHWIVECTPAWIGRKRRLPRDFERHASTVAALIRPAMIGIMLRRLTRPPTFRGP